MGSGFFLRSRFKSQPASFLECLSMSCLGIDSFFFFFFVENIFAYLLKNQKRLVVDGVSEILFGNANPTHYARITFLVGIIVFFGLIAEYEYIALFS